MMEITRTSNGYYEVYEPATDTYHLYNTKQAAQVALSGFGTRKINKPLNF